MQDVLPLRGKWLRRFLIFLVFTPLIASVLWTAEHPLHFEPSLTTNLEVGSRQKIGVFGTPILGLAAREVYPSGHFIGIGIGSWDWVIYWHKAYPPRTRRGE